MWRSATLCRCVAVSWERRGDVPKGEEAGELEQVGEGRSVPPERAKAGREICPLVHQGRYRHRPAAAHLADDVLVGHFGAVQEDFVERRPAVHLADRADLQKPRSLVHREGKAGDAVLPLRSRVGAGEEYPVVGLPGVARPDLLAMDPPAAAFPGGTRAQRGQVAARVWLAEELAPDLLPIEDPGQEALLLGGGAVGDDRRPRPPGAHHG